MTRHLRPVDQPSGPRVLTSRAEIDEWCAERRRVLTALCEAQGLGGPRLDEATDHEHVQLQLDEVA